MLALYACIRLHGDLDRGVYTHLGARVPPLVFPELVHPHLVPLALALFLSHFPPVLSKNKILRDLFDDTYDCEGRILTHLRCVGQLAVEWCSLLGALIT